MQDNNNNTVTNQIINPLAQVAPNQATDLLDEVGAYLAEARKGSEWQNLPYLVLCHMSAMHAPDGDLEYAGSYVAGRHADKAAAKAQAVQYNDLARQYGAINLQYEAVEIIPADLLEQPEAEF